MRTSKSLTMLNHVKLETCNYGWNYFSMSRLSASFLSICNHIDGGKVSLKWTDKHTHTQMPSDTHFGCVQSLHRHSNNDVAVSCIEMIFGNGTLWQKIMQMWREREKEKELLVSVFNSCSSITSTWNSRYNHDASCIVIMRTKQNSTHSTQIL